ncbi:MAG: flagellar basal body L-ring protein FlgH [Planctomycetota bacterium]
MKKPNNASILLATVAALAGKAAAQSTQTRPQVTTSPAATETAEEIAARMFAGSGSLLQAQLASRDAVARGIGQPGSAIDADVSFFAIPAPEPTLVRRHDLITVIVREESSSRSQGSADYEKDYTISADLQEYVNLNLGDFRLIPKAGGQALDFEAGRSFAGDGQNDRRDSFVTRITAEVMDVKPNGTLVIQARKRITTDNDEQLIVLTGTCRTADVTAGNTVLSTQLHDLHLQKHTRGPVRDAAKRGWLPRAVDVVNPF